MDCKQWNETWVAYLYDECSEEESAAVERHLAVCEDCRARMAGLDGARSALRATTPEIAAPPRVIVLPGASRRATGWSWFAGGFAAAAAVFVLGLFVGMNFFSTEKTVLETAGRQDFGELAGSTRIDDGRAGFESGIQQVRNEYRGLDDRLGRIERCLPENQGDTPVRLATEDRLQVAVGNLFQEIDLRRNQDLQLFLQAIYATEQTARRRDVTLSQAIEIMSAENDPNVTRH